jgi:hypothetical protein
MEIFYRPGLPVGDGPAATRTARPPTPAPAAVAGIIAPSAKDHVLANLDDWSRFFLRTGTIVILFGGLNASDHVAAASRTAR